VIKDTTCVLLETQTTSPKLGLHVFLVVSLLFVVIYTNKQNSGYNNITSKHENKLHDNILCDATNPYVRKPPKLELRL
jgi:hypothetical protein